MYVSMKYMLERARLQHYGVLAINCFNLETAMATIKAAEELQSPIIIDLLQEHLVNHIDCNYLTQGIIAMAQDSKVEVAINLDHGQDLNHLEKCIENGFSSVMADSSMYDLETNIERTKQIVHLAHSKGVTVEAEVGSMGAVNGDAWTVQDMFTKPDEAIRFINETGVDCLAVSYGSSHGDYPEGYVPEFRFDIVEAISSQTHTPLVLHGGSGAGETAIKKSIELGVAKINVGSDFMKAQYENLARNIKSISDYPLLIHKTMDAGKEIVKKYIRIAGSENKSVIKKEEEYVIKYDPIIGNC